MKDRTIISLTVIWIIGMLLLLALDISERAQIKELKNPVISYPSDTPSLLTLYAQKQDVVSQFNQELQRRHIYVNGNIAEVTNIDYSWLSTNSDGSCTLDSVKTNVYGYWFNSHQCYVGEKFGDDWGFWITNK